MKSMPPQASKWACAGVKVVGMIAVEIAAVKVVVMAAAQDVAMVVAVNSKINNVAALHP
jgi:hypothetical protein